MKCMKIHLFLVESLRVQQSPGEGDIANAQATYVMPFTRILVISPARGSSPAFLTDSVRQDPLPTCRVEAAHQIALKTPASWSANKRPVSWRASPPSPAKARRTRTKPRWISLRRTRQSTGRFLRRAAQNSGAGGGEGNRRWKAVGCDPCHHPHRCATSVCSHHDGKAAWWRSSSW